MKSWVVVLIAIGVVVPTLSPLLFDFDGYSAIKLITSNSMYPTLKKGDLLVVAKVWDAYGQLKEGDIIAFKGPDAIVVHRIYRIEKELTSTGDNPNEVMCITTKGDANSGSKPYEVDMSPSQVVGKVVFVIPYPSSILFGFAPILAICILVTWRLKALVAP